MANNKQMEIPGTERKTIKSIDEAAEELRKIRARRMKLTEEEGKAAEKLKKLLIKNELRGYVYESDESDDDGNPVLFDVVLGTEDDLKVKVRKHKEPKPSDDGAGEEA